MDTRPLGSHGLSAFDRTQGFALTTDVERQLVPFQVLDGQAGAEVAKRMFENFAELYGIFSRYIVEEALKKQEELNKKRVIRTFSPGEVVFRRLPSYARPQKHLMGEPCSGPYYVVKQNTYSSVVLRKEDGTLLDEGANIPLDQILAAPRRSKLNFEDDDDSEKRSVSQMLAGSGASPRRVSLRQMPSGRKKGWTGLGLNHHQFGVSCVYCQFDGVFELATRIILMHKTGVLVEMV